MELLFTVVLSVTSIVALPRQAQESSLDGPSSKALQSMLHDIYEERTFDTLLVVQERNLDFTTSEAIHQLSVPKVFLDKDHSYEFIRKFNAEILVVVLMTHNLEKDLLATAAQTLNYMRQTRILVVADNVPDLNTFKAELLNLCQKYKMTNVILKFVNAEGEMFKLIPYPQYRWDLADLNKTNNVYYTTHWRNMYNTTLITFTDITMTLSYPFEDAQGNIKLNGYVARLILLFAERYNVHLKMFASWKVAAETHFSTINQMVEDNLVDIPMVLSSDIDGKWLYKSYVYELLEGILMIPCAQALSIRDVFSILLDGYFFGRVIICTLLFSIIHSLIDYLFDGLLQPSNFMLNDRILPAVLGQSFQAKKSSWVSLKLVYFLLFFSGLNISTQFMANVNTLFTSPPYQRQIKTFEDLNQSPLKILVLSGDAHAIGDTVTPIVKSMILTDSVPFYEENRNNFNTSTGYFLISMSWKILNRKQHYFRRKVFCAYENMALFRTSPAAIQLQPHSEYKEPLDYLIHQVHDLGLAQHWYSSTFSDMLRTKKITIRDPNPVKSAKVLVVTDLFWVWIILVIGWTVSCVVFLTQLWSSNRTRSNRDSNKIVYIRKTALFK